jgi:HAMP domain-containing protein
MIATIMAIAVKCNHGAARTTFVALLLFIVFWAAFSANGWIFGYLD